MNGKLDRERLKNDILRIMYDYVSEPTFTDSENELKVADFFKRSVETIPYLKEHPEYVGLFPIPNDCHGRSVGWAMVRGKGPKTVVLIHHYDIVPIEDYKTFKDLAFKPDELREKFLEAADTFPENVRKDLLSGEWMFGRGVNDMKGGGAMQFALLTQYGEDPAFEGNVIVLAVPDEENLSSGMRGAVLLLSELKKKYGLEYVCMIDSESHQRKDPSKAVIYLGSIGKLMPFVCVRGMLAHSGKSFEGLNPSAVMADVVSMTELNMDLADAMDGESAPGPTWLYIKDSKTSYDVSMPLSMYGCLNVLTLTQTPGELMAKIRPICEKAFEKALARANAAYHVFLKNKNKPEEDLPYSAKVMTFGELYAELTKADPGFEADYKAYNEKLTADFVAGRLSMIDYNRVLVDHMLDHRAVSEPVLICGLVPPYYPSVASLEFEEPGGLMDILSDFSEKNFGLPLINEHYYTGISDLSYAQIENAAAIRKTMEDSCPLFGGVYDLPLEEIEEISMPVINIGPWGEDLHRMAERVNAKELLEIMPAVLDKAVKTLLKG